MATNVKFSAGLESDLLKLNSDKSYVVPLDKGHIYFATKTNDEGEVIGSIFYDTDTERVSMGGGVAEQAKADDMKENIADKYVTRISSEGTTYASTDGVTITTYNGRNASLDTITLPVASANRAGTVITGAQTFAGNKTFNNNILFPNVSTGISSGIRWTVGDSDGARIITGATASDAGYLEIAVKSDGNEPIYVRQYSGDFATLVRTLTLLDASGNTIIPGSLLPTAKDTKDLGSEAYRWNNAYIKNVQADTLSGHLTGSLTGNVTGNVTGHASLDLPLAGGTMTGDITFKTIASWPTASGETYPIKSKGLKWNGSSDNAAIYYQVDGSDSGHLYISMGDDDAASVKFAKNGTAHTIFDSAGKLYPVTNDTGYIGTSSNKFKAIYATNFYGIIEKAYQDESGNNIKATYAATLKNHAHDGNGWSFRLLNKNGAALADALTIPGATAEKAGLITTGAQTFAGKKTFNGQVVIANTTDAAKATANSGALIVGNPSGEHLAIDENEIMAKASGTTVRALLFQLDGGETKFGGNVLPYTTDTHSLGTEALAWKEAHIGEIYGHLNGSLTGPVSGNASTASKWLTARKVTMTGDVTGNFTIDGSKDVSFASSIANYSIKPVKLAVQDYANYSQLNRHTAAHWGFSVDTTSSAEGAIYTMNTLSRDKFISEEFPCKGGEKLIISYEISTSVKGNTTNGGTDSAYRGTAIGIYGYRYANKNTSAGISYSTRVTGTADAPWTKVESIVTVPATARYFYVFVQTESYGNFSGSLKIRNLEVRSAGGVTDAKGDEILPKYITKIDFAQANVSSSDTTKKLNIRLYDGNNTIKSIVQVPNAAADAAGVVNTGTQTFAGNKTFTGRIHLSNTTDAAKSSDSGVLTIGNKSGENLILDGNEIMAKSGTTGVTTLYINNEGGNVQFGGSLIPNGNKTLDIGTSSNYWKNAYISNLVADTLSGHLTGSMTGNVTGNASSATKLLTARNIILGNDLQGSVSFDGTKDVTISAASYSASVNGGNTANYPWHRIATLATLTGDYNDKDAVIAIRHAYHGGGYGIAKISLRTNQASTGATANCSISWIIRYGIAEDALQAGFRNTAKDTYADIFYKCGTWPRATVYQLQGNRAWTLVSSQEVDNTTTTDAKTSKEVYATIAAAGTALGRTYTSTVVATDVGIVAKAFEDESGNNIKTSYLASIQQVTSDKDTFTFRGYNKNNAVMNNLITIPAATASGTDQTKWKAGLVTSQAQTWAGNKTFRGDITIQHSTVNTMGTTSTNPYLRFLNSDGSQGAYIMFTDYDSYRAPGGLKIFGTGSVPAWLEVEGQLIVGGASTLKGNITISGNIMPSVDAKADTTKVYTIGSLDTKWDDIYTYTAHVFKTLYVNSSGVGSEGGIALYMTTAPTDYGIAMRSNLGTHGYATDTWNTYFSMTGGSTRGWIFRNGGTNIASINGQGYISANKLNLNRTGSTANGRISWYSTTYKTWNDYMSNVVAGGCPSGGTPSILGAVKTWALRSYIENTGGYGWLWESAAESNTGTPTPRMALSSATGKLYLSNDLNIIIGDTDKFVHYLYDGTEANTVGASWRAGVLGSGSANANYYVIQSGTSATAATAWLNALRIGQNSLDFTVGTATLGSIGIANTSATSGNGISLYGGAPTSGKPTYGLFFGGTATFKTHGGVTADWATYFTMDATANRGWVFLKDTTPVASISNNGLTKLGDGTGATASSSGSDTGALRVVGGISTTKNSYFHEKITFPENKIALEFSSRDTWHAGLVYDTSGHESMVVALENARTSFMVVQGTDPNSWTGGTWTGVTPVIQAKKGSLYINKLLNGDPSYNLHVEGTANITGAVTMGSTLDVTDIAKFKQGSAASGLNTGAVQITGGLSASAASYFGSTITAVGNITAPKFIGNLQGRADVATVSDRLDSLDTRSATRTPQDTPRGMTLNFKSNATAGLDDGGSYVGVMSWRSYSSGSDLTGGYPVEIAYTANNNLWMRIGTSATTWGGWNKILTSSNFSVDLNNVYVKKSGDTMTGMLRVNNAPIFGYRYGASNNAPAFIFDKSGSYYTGIGANGEADTILFSAVTSDGNWNWETSYKQKWKFNGNIIADTMYATAKDVANASFRTTDGAANYILVKINSSQTHWMTAFTLRVYQGYNVYDVTFSGYQYGTNYWYSPKATLSSNSTVTSLTAYFGYNSQNEMWVAIPGSSYTGAKIINVVNGYQPLDMVNAFSITRVASLPGTAQTSQTIYRPWIRGEAITNAVWNDYAECREADTEEPGYVLVEKGDDTLTKATERLQAFAGIVSDTWGFSQGETDRAKTNIAVAGRVLAYTYQPRERYKPGDCVCAAPGGLVDIMTREEVIKYPDRIIGTVSHVPDYEEWGGGSMADRDPVKINGRIWIKIK